MPTDVLHPNHVRVGKDVFERVVCGVDLTAAGLEAARQAAGLVNDGGSLLLVTAVVGEPVAVTSAAGLGGTVAHTAPDESTRARHRAALANAERAAQGAFPRTRVSLIDDDPLDALLDAIRDERATLAVVGSHDYRRLPGITLGSVATHLVHKAPCSVLIARPHGNRPGRVLAGIDGSTESMLALAVARDLALRLDGQLETLVAYGGRPVHDLDAVVRLAPDVATFDEPVHALVSQATAADVIVLGSRALRGLHALGSVSERVAHRAPCSVLVVRPEKAGQEERNAS
jgi:nucleotide-binding universal stress UspA family protein